MAGTIISEVVSRHHRKSEIAKAWTVYRTMMHVELDTTH